MEHFSASMKGPMGEYEIVRREAWKAFVYNLLQKGALCSLDADPMNNCTINNARRHVLILPACLSTQLFSDDAMMAGDFKAA